MNSAAVYIYKIELCLSPDLAYLRIPHTALDAIVQGFGPQILSEQVLQFDRETLDTFPVSTGTVDHILKNLIAAEEHSEKSLRTVRENVQNVKASSFFAAVDELRIQLSSELLRTIGSAMANGVEDDCKYKQTKEDKNIKDNDALSVRSDTKVMKDVIKAGENLKGIGRAGAGVDNIDINAATTNPAFSIRVF
ncbi:hypothetical protein WA026_019266 [Henosepilachna vigintioctopunctata]|uniref:D-isomer specific 2-hydroxyacid dehydrogenase catalytic domain-containing protein n=1 Tax=Henosepilachna vigintioctopunctata TaxID=420089 RepID=A0AAW1UA68_9CUCU